MLIAVAEFYSIIMDLKNLTFTQLCLEFPEPSEHYLCLHGLESMAYLLKGLDPLLSAGSKINLKSNKK